MQVAGLIAEAIRHCHCRWIGCVTIGAVAPRLPAMAASTGVQTVTEVIDIAKQGF